MRMVLYIVLFEANDETVRAEFETTTVAGVPRVVCWTVLSECGATDDPKWYQQPWGPLFVMVGQDWCRFDSIRFWPSVVLPDY
jgi:hypothetical protein